MIKKKYFDITLDCILQKGEISENQCPSGVISKNSDGTFRFVEEIRKGRAPRNPRLFDGRFVSMVRRPDGNFHLHLKNCNFSTFDRDNYPFCVYAELASAVELMGNGLSDPLPPEC